MGSRPGWNEYFSCIARQVATRSTCLRRQVGCVIVLEKRIVATGYNGAPSGMLHCEDTGCLRDQRNVPPGERHELCRGLHAEQNALIQAAMHGTAVRGGALYSTHHPCILCSKMLINAGIARIYYLNGYPDRMARRFLEEAGVESILLEAEAEGL